MATPGAARTYVDSPPYSRYVVKPRWIAAAFVLPFLCACIAGASPGASSYDPGKYANTTIDSFPLGGQWQCANGCPDEIKLALEALNIRVPNHAKVVSQTLYEEGNGVRRSGSFVVGVFELEDGTVVAAGVSCAGVNPCEPSPTYLLTSGQQSPDSSPSGSQPSPG